MSNLISRTPYTWIGLLSFPWNSFYCIMSLHFIEVVKLHSHVHCLWIFTKSAAQNSVLYNSQWPRKNQEQMSQGTNPSHIRWGGYPSITEWTLVLNCSVFTFSTYSHYYPHNTPFLSVYLQFSILCIHVIFMVLVIHKWMLILETLRKLQIRLDFPWDFSA
jgi:hypothetical protein